MEQEKTPSIQFNNPKMLKEFLRTDSILSTNYNLNSSSSSGFKSYPRVLPDNDTCSITNSGPNSNKLQRSRSRSRAVAEAAFGKIRNAVKSFHSSSSTSLTLTRTFSRRFLGKWNVKKKQNKSSGEMINNTTMVVTVKVKDILRFKSFREERNESQPLDLVVGPTTNAPSCDYIATEELPCGLGSFGVEEGKNWEADEDDLLASDSEVGPTKDDNDIGSDEEREQQSPVSVLESPFRDDASENEDFISSFDQSLANMERTKQRLLQSIQLFESLAGVYEDENEDEVQEEDDEEEEEEEEEDNATEANSKAYLRKEIWWFKKGEKGLEEEMEYMDKQRHWKKFNEEIFELGLDLEVLMFNDLLVEAFLHFCE